MSNEGEPCHKCNHMTGIHGPDGCVYSAIIAGHDWTCGCKEVVNDMQKRHHKSPYVIENIHRIEEVRAFIRVNEVFLTDDQAYDIQGTMAKLIESNQICYCHHSLVHHKGGVCRNLQCECVEFEVKK